MCYFKRRAIPGTLLSAERDEIPNGRCVINLPESLVCFLSLESENNARAIHYIYISSLC